MTQEQYTYFGPISVIGPLGTEQVETLELAVTLLAQKKVEFVEKTKRAFSVNGCTINSAGDKAIFPCDLSASEPPTVDFFEAFHYQTGVYTRFDEFQPAKDFVLALQAEYLAAADSSFTLQQQVQVPEGEEPMWVTLPVG
jgi:hypothetical protein